MLSKTKYTKTCIKDSFHLFLLPLFLYSLKIIKTKELNFHSIQSTPLMWKSLTVDLIVTLNSYCEEEFFRSQKHALTYNRHQLQYDTIIS